MTTPTAKLAAQKVLNDTMLLKAFIQRLFDLDLTTLFCASYLITQASCLRMYVAT